MVCLDHIFLFFFLFFHRNIADLIMFDKVLMDYSTTYNIIVTDPRVSIGTLFQTIAYRVR